MVWTFKDVEELREKYYKNSIEKVSQEEIQKLENYVEIKEQFKDKPGQYKKHYKQSKRLLQTLKDKKHEGGSGE